VEAANDARLVVREREPLARLGVDERLTTLLSRPFDIVRATVDVLGSVKP
jgi:hypothetical protein